MRAELIEDIKSKLNLQGGDFINAEIESFVIQLNPKQYIEFFNALTGDEYKFLKGMDRIKIVFKKLYGSQETNLENDAKVIATMMHDVHKLVTSESQMKGYDYVKLMRAVNIRSTLNLTDKQAYAMNQVVGKEVIMRINTIDPIWLEKVIIEALQKYDREEKMITLSAPNASKKNLM